MKIRKLSWALRFQIVITAFLLAGCGSAKQPEPAKNNTNTDAVRMVEETQRVAETALGKQAEILAHGDLARNGQVQLLVIDRVAKSPPRGALENSQAIFITRAVILEKANGKWAEILRCDEHLKNPSGYLGGSSRVRANGWKLEFRTDTKQGLEIKLTPVDTAAGQEETGMGDSTIQTVVVRWNPRAKRYQSLDTSHEGYLSEAPALETPHSILR